MTSQKMSVPDIVQTLAAYVAIPVALVYPFGFFALFVQFTKYFYLDFYSAWYAASLVNRMVAVGQGVTILVLALIGSVLLSAKIAQILIRYSKWEEPRGFGHRPILIAKLTALLAVTFVLYIAYSRILAGGRVTWFVLRGRESAECDPARALRHQLNLWPDSLVPALFYVLGCSAGGWLIYASYRAYREALYARQRRSPSEDYHLRPGFFNRGVTEGWIWSGLATAYAVSVIASIVLAVFTPAFISYTTYGSTVEYIGSKEPTHNRFLSQAEGHWYLLHRIERDNGDSRSGGTPDYRIVSIAAAQVKHVRVSPNPPRASRVEPLPWGLGEQPLDLPEDHCKPKKDT